MATSSAELYQKVISRITSRNVFANIGNTKVVLLTDFTTIATSTLSWSREVAQEGRSHSSRS